jgi:hypothetical protein
MPNMALRVAELEAYRGVMRQSSPPSRTSAPSVAMHATPAIPSDPPAMAVNA